APRRSGRTGRWPCRSAWTSCAGTPDRRAWRPFCAADRLPTNRCQATFPSQVADKRQVLLTYRNSKAEEVSFRPEVGDKERRNGRHRVTVDLLRELAASLDALTNAASPHAGLNRTDMRALDIINMQQGLTAGQLAGRLKLTTGAITGVLDRLERGGHARRTHDKEDRRRV